MHKKILLLTILTFLFLPQSASANLLITPALAHSIPLFLIIVLIEACAFWLLANKIIKVRIGFWKMLLITLVANIVTSLLGTLITIYKSIEASATIIGIAFVLSVFIEWIIYIPFFKKTNINKLDLLKISFASNLITYAILTFFELM